MALAVWQSTIVNRSGDVQPNAQVEVRLESSGALAAIYADRDGNTPLDNPFSADSNGFARFYAAGGAYKITASLGDFSHTYRHQSIGLLAEQDVATDDKFYYRQTAAEIAAGVTPSDYSYPPGDIRRYGDNATPGTTDMTTAISNAIKTGLVIFQEEEYSTNQLDVENDCVFVFMPGTTLKARVDQDAGCNVLHIEGGPNVTIIGNGGLIAHDKTEYGDNGAESDHTIEIFDATVYIENLRVADGGGDNVYVRHADADVTLVNVKADNAHRNNFSVVLCRRYVAIGCEGTDAAGTNPEAGWDIEPNPGDTASHMYVRLIDCKTSGNKGGGYKLTLHNADSIDFLDIEMSGCSSDGDDQIGFALSNRSDAAGVIKINDLVVRESGFNPIQFRSQEPADNLHIEINRPVLIDGNVAGSSSELAKSFIAWNTSTGGDRGNVTINSPTFIETRGASAEMVYGIYMSIVDNVERVKIRDIRFSGITIDNMLRILNGTAKTDIEITFAEEQRHAVTSNQNVGARFLGQLITNEGDEGSTRIHTLVSNNPVGRKRFRFLNTTGNTLRLEPGASNSFNPLAGEGLDLRSNAIGDYIEIEYEPAISDWRVVNIIGTWTVNS